MSTLVKIDSRVSLKWSEIIMQIATLFAQFMQLFENIELLPFSSENLFLMLYKCSSENADWI